MGDKPRSYLWNCQLWVRDGDGPLFTSLDGGTDAERVEASLDGYVILPIEKAREMFKDPSVLDVVEPPCDVGPDEGPACLGDALRSFSAVCRAAAKNHPPTPLERLRHHPAGIEPPELYEQWRTIERARERDLMASCPDVKSYTQACRYMAGPTERKPEPYQAEGAVFARLIAKG